MYSNGSTAGLNRDTFSFESICISSPGSYLLALRFDCASGTARYHLAEFSISGIEPGFLWKYAEKHEDSRYLAVDKDRHQRIHRIFDCKELCFALVTVENRLAFDHLLQHRKSEEIPNDVLVRVDSERPI